MNQLEQLETRVLASKYRHGSRAFLTASLLIAVLGACGITDSIEPVMSADVEQFVTFMNGHRASVGCGPLTWMSEVTEVALSHSQDMLQRDFFDHVNPDGASPFDRLRAAGVDYSIAAENIAWGYVSAESVLDAWIDSPGHRANLENCDLTHHGVGLSETHWTHMFVTP